MGLAEDLRSLDPDRRQLVDVEKAPVVDLLGGHPPERQAVGLSVEQRVEVIEAGRLADLAVELRDAGLQAGAELGPLRRQGRQPSFDHLFLPIALSHLGRIGHAGRRQVEDGGQNALQLDQLLVVSGQVWRQPLQGWFEDQAVSVWRDRQERVVIVQEEGAVGVGQPELPVFEHGTVLVAQDWQQDAIVQSRLRGVPGDVEEGGVGRGWPVLE
jgi:hypothetical protein